MILTELISSNLNEPNLLGLIKEKVFKDAKEIFAGKSDEEKLEISKSFFAKVCTDLDEFSILNSKNVDVVLESINKAMNYDAEQYLYKIMFERDRLKKQIKDEKQHMKTLMSLTCKGLEEFISTSKFKNKDEISKILKDRLINDLELLGILKETAESAFLTTIEMGNDVEDTAYEIAKSMVYLAINEGELSKSRFMDITLVVIESAISISNESKIYAKELLKGAINGSNDGISKAIEKFKDELKFIPDEISDSLELSIKEITKVEDEFISLLKELSTKCDEPASSIITEILQSDYDTYFARLRRISAEAREQILEKIEEIRGKSLRLKDGLNIDEKILNLKKEIVELEKKASQKFAQMKSLQTFENAKEQAKKLGDRVYEAAKNLIDNSKKS